MWVPKVRVGGARVLLDFPSALLVLCIFCISTLSAGLWISVCSVFARGLLGVCSVSSVSQSMLLTAHSMIVPSFPLSLVSLDLGGCRLSRFSQQGSPPATLYTPGEADSVLSVLYLLSPPPVYSELVYWRRKAQKRASNTVLIGCLVAAPQYTATHLPSRHSARSGPND